MPSWSGITQMKPYFTKALLLYTSWQDSFKEEGVFVGDEDVWPAYGAALQHFTKFATIPPSFVSLDTFLKLGCH